jgi:hypothetical protein
VQSQIASVRELIAWKEAAQGAQLVQPSSDEEQFKATLYANYRDRFEAIATFKGFVTDEYYDALVLIFPRAYKSYDSIRRLCEVALCEDAAVILRSLLNLLVVTRWISLRLHSRASKYLGWYWVEMHRETEKSKFPVPPQHLAEIKTQFARVKVRFEYRDAKGKIRMPAQWYSRRPRR